VTRADWLLALVAIVTMAAGLAADMAGLGRSTAVDVALLVDLSVCAVAILAIYGRSVARGGDAS
jgi:hypothetical protein